MIGITGTPGVGKHTVAKIISEELKLKILDLTQLIIKSEMNPDEVDVDVLNKLVHENITPNTILVGHLVPDVITYDSITHVIILRRDPYDLRKIYQERDYSQEKSLENLGSEILGVVTSDTIQRVKEKAYQIDTTNLTAEDTAKSIINILNGENIPCEIDWLEMIKQKGDLQEFFKY